MEIGSEEEKGFPKKVCSAAVEIGSGDELLLQWCCARSDGRCDLRMLRRRTCNLRYYALPESRVTDDVTCDGKFWNMGVVCVQPW